MGVTGLHRFMERCSSDACVTVNLKDMVREQAKNKQNGYKYSDPTIVVDGMACLRYWYKCEDWICGGQWKEYLTVLKNWVEAFTTAGIKLVFIFDGVVEDQKRTEWVKRRLRVNGDISKVFNYIRQHGKQPGKEFFCLPSSLATFTPFALRSFGQEVFCSVREADYEIANYARQHNCMGILGQDSDFLVYDSAPYLSVAKLQIDSLTTVLYDRQRLCKNIRLAVTKLPLMACLLGTDVVSEEKMRHIRRFAIDKYKATIPQQHFAPGLVVLAVAQFVSSFNGEKEDDSKLVPDNLNVSDSHRELLKRGIHSYLLPGDKNFDQLDIAEPPAAFQDYIHPEILKACRERHVAAEGYMVYAVLCAGVVQCSNSLEDEQDSVLLPQALVYKYCRQRIYGLLLLHGHEDTNADLIVIKEWFVFPGNCLKKPELVHPVPIIFPGYQPSLDTLWFSTGPEVSSLRVTAFLSIFDCIEYLEWHGRIEDSLLACLCLVTYITLQDQSLSQEDVDAYLSQAVCLNTKSPMELQQIKLPLLNTRAVQLGCLYVRGLSCLLGANTATNYPLSNSALMPWHCFDGRLFHSKYIMAHTGTDILELLEGNASFLSNFIHLRHKITEICLKKGRVLHSRPRTRDLQPSSDEVCGSRRPGGEPFDDGRPFNGNQLPPQSWGRSHLHRGRNQPSRRWQQPFKYGRGSKS